jgi:glycosyltransferase involved in cell wall biosynthesis
MISLDTTILTQDIGDSRERHQEYADRAGHITVVVYAPRAGRHTPAAPSPRLTIIPTNSLHKAAFVWDAYRLAAHAHRRRPIDVATTQDPFATGLAGLLLKWRFGVPLNVQNHSTFMDQPQFIGERPLNRLLNRLGKLVVTRADTHRTVNAREQAYYVERLGIDPARVWVVPVATNLARFLEPVAPEAVQEARAKLGLRQGQPVVLWAGRPVTVKNLPLLFEAAGRARRDAPDLRLVLVGDFSEAEHLQQQAKQILGESVIFAGRAPHADLPAYYALSDVYALSSDIEGMPRVLVEAAAAGLPIVSTDIPGAGMAVIDGETGYLTPVGDADAFAARLAHLLTHPDTARQMGQRGRAHAQARFDPDRLTDALVATWRDTVALKRTGKR